MKLILFIAIIFTLPLFVGEGWGDVKAQDKNLIDSLLNAFNSGKHDTLCIETCVRLGDAYELSIPDSALYFYHKAIDLVDKNLDANTTPRIKYACNSLKAKTLQYIAIVKDSQSNFEKAIEYNLRALKIRIEIEDKKGMSWCYNNIGVVYRKMGDYQKAIESLLKALKIGEELEDKKDIARCYTNIGNVHFDQGNYDKAINYFLKLLEISKELGDRIGLSDSYNNLGVVSEYQGKLDKALEYYQNSLKIYEEFDIKNGMSICYGNIGIVYERLGNYDNAIEYYKKALKIKEEKEDKNGEAVIYGNLANLYVSLADSTALSERQALDYLNKAKDYALQEYQIGVELGAVPIQNTGAANLQEAYKKLGNSDEALKYAQIFIATKDSMFNNDKISALAEMDAKYQTEKMQKQQELDNITIEAQQAKNKKQLIIIIAAAIGFLLLLVFAVIVLRMFRQKRKDNVLLAEHKDLIEQKNRDILDSINYAKRIQSAILPQDKLVKEYFKESFILYKPKDIVAGDFYWMEQVDNKILFAAADCTGHGVPGAMVSVVCNNGLNRSVRENGLTEPGKILDKTREIIVKEFEKSDEEVNDGMDIALCSLYDNKLEYAGAHNPLWIIRKGEILETKANKQPIGVFRFPRPFINHIFDLQKGDSIYIFTDGFVDQFGGEKGKKFKSKAFKELLLSIQSKNMEEQRLLLDNSFENWKGNLEQIDDVCVIGVKI